jgi:UDP-N-acetylglucosamine 2-epimerase (non-hydrolysing)
LAANRLGLKIVHLEGGLRSFDIVMAEEVNRMIADYLSELIFIPTHNAKSNLLKEGVSELKIAYSGNTIVDSIYQNLKIAQKKISIFKKLGLKERQYFLVTLHRSENVDIKERLESILNGFNLVYKRFKMPLVFPLHPRTKKMLDNFGLKIPKGVLVLDPISFLEFILLESKARLVLTDSGGLQEESCVMKIPCVTLRDNTERPETIEAGVNILCGTESSKIYEGVNAMLTRKIKWVNPFGDGKSAERIILTLIEYHNAKHKKIL